ncbi:hypothetical protein [Halolamina sp. C58]|jgi:hypothetical protein|uniref:hypothetical protein n=1 Tax=Halolamina sp. C58 TaxID=3421640 RepID=UPI003EBEE498
MPAKSGAAHSLGYLVCIVVSGFLNKTILTYLPPFERLSRIAGNLLQAYLEVPVEEELAGVMLVIGVLLAVWGAGYHVYRS